MRVKIYCLEEADTGPGLWVDRGTGFVGVERGCITVRDEPVGESHSPAILSSRIRMEDIYERQGESIIMWRETSSSIGHDHNGAGGSATPHHSHDPHHEEHSPELTLNGDIDYALSFQDPLGCTAVW